jgi:hypothetical protein
MHIQLNTHVLKYSFYALLEKMALGAHLIRLSLSLFYIVMSWNLWTIFSYYSFV